MGKLNNASSLHRIATVVSAAASCPLLPPWMDWTQRERGEEDAYTYLHRKVGIIKREIRIIQLLSPSELVGRAGNVLHVGFSVGDILLAPFR